MEQQTNYVTPESLRKKARRKYLSSAVAAGLVSLSESTLHRSYLMTFGCCRTLEVHDDEQLKSLFYCKHRWCSTCSAIKMGIMINKYLPQIDPLPELHFVTLTLRTVPADQLADRYRYMLQTWRKITDLARKSRPGFVGLRKTELKPARRGLYHPHFHIIVSGAENAEFIRSTWLRLAGDLAGPKGQDVSPVWDTERALIELMKYSVKCTVADDSRNEILAPPWQLDVIFRTLYRKRLYQPFGGLRAADEDDFEITPESVKKAAGYYEWVGTDWWHRDFAQALTGYTPDDLDIALTKWR